VKLLRFLLPLCCAVSLGAQDAPADSALRPSPAFGWPEARGFGLTFAAGGLAYLADESLRDAVRGSGPQGSTLLDGLADGAALAGGLNAQASIFVNAFDLIDPEPVGWTHRFR